MASDNTLSHSTNRKYGENIYMSSDCKMSDSDAAKKATISWNSEESKYRFNNKFSSGTGHFTQLVWKSTKYLGIGVARSSSGVYVCASYDPPGNLNVVSEFLKNVLRI